jgi:hypothetical protein
MKSQSLVCVYIGCVEARDRVIATFGNAFEDVSMSDDESEQAPPEEERPSEGGGQALAGPRPSRAGQGDSQDAA